MSKWVHINKALRLTVFITLVWGQWHSIKTVMIPYIGFLLKCLQAKIHLDSMLFLFIWSYVCFQGTSPEEKISSSPWLTEHSSLRQRLAQEGQRRADRTPHTSSQVKTVWLLIEHNSPCSKQKLKDKRGCTKLDHVSAFCSSKALSSYRQIRRKYREQVWRLEQKVAVMTESHLNQSGASKTPEEGVEWRREETIL